MGSRISIVTPSYNQGRYLEETIRSIVDQREDVHEFFVYDGGSTDNSVDIIRKYESQIDYWVSEKDKGQADVLKRGFARATGDILYWLNSDDVLLPGVLRKVREAFDLHPEWAALTGWQFFIDGDSRIVRFFRMPPEQESWLRWGILHVSQQTCFFKKSVYDSVGGVNPDLHFVMDSDLWVRMLQTGAPWGGIPAYMAGFRQHEEAKGHPGGKWAQRYREEELELMKRSPQYFNPVKLKIGTWGHRLKQVLSGRYMAAVLDTRRSAGKQWNEVIPATHGQSQP